MSNNHTLHLSGCIVLTLILAALAGMQPQAIVADTFDDYIIHQDSLNCVIALSGHPGEKEDRSVGLNRDMLQYFGDFANVDVDIVPDNCDLTYLDSLKDGKVDIVVMAYPQENIAESDIEKILVSNLIRNNIHWAMSSRDPHLLLMVNIWLDDFKGSRLYKRTVARQYRTYSRPRINPETGQVSPFDDLIKQYSQKTGIDWLLLASLMYQESQYFVGAEYKEAKGLMQVNDVTAARYGVSDLFSPEGNIKAGSYHLRYLMNIYRQEGLDSLNVIKFALAAYNAGDGRIEQCRNHALSEGKNPNDWEEVVTTFATNNKFIGRTTTAYVRDIIARWEDLRESVH